MSHDDPFSRMAAALPKKGPARAAPRRRSQPSFAEPTPRAVPVRKKRMARSEPEPSIALSGETRPRQAIESGPDLPSVMLSKPAPSATTRRQIAAPTVRRARGPVLTMTTAKKSAVLLFLAFSIAVFALGVAAFFFAKSPAPRFNAASQPAPDARLAANR